MSDEELLALAAKHGVSVGAPAEPARMSDADLLALASKHGVSTRQQAPESLSPNETFAASLAPKGIISSLYGASEAAPELFKGGFSPALDKYRKERDSARGLLDNSAKENPRAALAGNVAGIAPFAIAAGPSIAGQAALSGAYSLADSKADLTRLDDPEQRGQAGRDLGTGLLTGTVLGAAGRYAPLTTALAGGGALAGGLGTGSGTGELVGLGAGLLGRGAIAAPAVAGTMGKMALKAAVHSHFPGAKIPLRLLEGLMRGGGEAAEGAAGKVAPAEPPPRLPPLGAEAPVYDGPKPGGLGLIDDERLSRIPSGVDFGGEAEGMAPLAEAPEAVDRTPITETEFKSRQVKKPVNPANAGRDPFFGKKAGGGLLQ